MVSGLTHKHESLHTVRIPLKQCPLLHGHIVTVVPAAVSGNLDTSLRKLNSRLFVIRGQPANIFPRLFKDWNISQLTFECDSEPFGKERDAAIKKLATEAGVEVVSRTSHTLYDLDKIMALNGGHPPLTFKRFQMLVGSMLPPDSPVEALSQASMGRCVTPVLDNHTDKYGVPLLEELGFDTDGLAPAVWPGGESEALTRVEKQLRPDLSTTWQVNFERPRNTASPLLPSPLGLSPYLRFGCLSCRLFYSKLAELYKEVVYMHTQLSILNTNPNSQ
ncbi:unnamed protein product [Oncorhynchus mykiss]|uniref:Photolyase/cryptochrome alpha/beta domain-containing protein n=1 Tax=Oncorhynchus mykiss TaxID=8022 RepID=A0A060XT41_ONCMY|nr:unnamed protein product [Oncorhynchus mykiss]